MSKVDLTKKFHDFTDELDKTILRITKLLENGRQDFEKEARETEPIRISKELQQERQRQSS